MLTKTNYLHKVEHYTLNRFYVSNFFRQHCKLRLKEDEFVLNRAHAASIFSSTV